MALRDYLRNNYRYKLHATPTPPGEESVDYFLFTLKEGHCEYFAAALTVLARAAGLPARVATGYSPGNYNTMTNLFEVHEYHAHAWSHIYISEIGWLTMDATPPQNIRSETRPIGIGALRDPFGDEWKITPPEITEQTLQFIKNDIIKEARKNEDAGTLEKALIKTAVAQEAIQQNIKKTIRRRSASLTREQGKFSAAEPECVEQSSKGVTNLLQTSGTIPGFALLSTACGSPPPFFPPRFLGTRSRRYGSAGRWKTDPVREKKSLKEDPSQRSLHLLCLRLAWSSQEFTGRKNMELLDYANSFRKLDSSFRRSLESISAILPSRIRRPSTGNGRSGRAFSATGRNSRAPVALQSEESIPPAVEIVAEHLIPSFFSLTLSEYFRKKKIAPERKKQHLFRIF